MGILERIGFGGNAGQVDQQIERAGQAMRGPRPQLDSWLPDGVDAAHWPPGWNDQLSDFWVDRSYRSRYLRGPAGGDLERGLLDSWDSHPDPTRIEFSFKEDSVAPRAVRLSRFDPDAHDLLRHVAALTAAYGAWAAERTHEAAERQRKARACLGCGDPDFDQPPPQSILHVPSIKPGERACPACRTSAFARYVEIVNAQVLPDGRTRGDAVAAWLGSRR